MPLYGTGHSELVKLGKWPYFKSLAELDEWRENSTHAGSLDVLPYKPRSSEFAGASHGKLLVCHDYKGGYTEDPSNRAYTFNFWSTCDVFVYFSHHRVAVPPPGWVNAAHRHGTKILGTLIFEGGGEQDCLRLLVGKLPASKTGPAAHSMHSLPLSAHYAVVLAELAVERGFEGYLLNFEVPLEGAVEQARVLSAWITILRRELVKRVGSHAEVVWYDSVAFTGALRWQDRLNALNLPFFLPSNSIFTNYTWPHLYPSKTAEYFFSLDAHLTQETSTTPSKSLRDIYTGVDVWGRGSHGGGGFGSYKALTHIDPASLGLSVALFGQAWTWETEQDKPGFTWDNWWSYDCTLWTGPSKNGEPVDVPEAPRREGEPECPHEPFLPIQSFFPSHPPPNPSILPFHTTFSPGVGLSWWIEGAIKVLDASPNGWTDVDKQTSLGDLLWPRPQIQWDGEQTRAEPLPVASSHVLQHDAWNGGSCLKVSLWGPGSDDEDAFFRCVWVPIQSLAITPSTSYQATVVYKTTTSGGEADLGLSLKVSNDPTRTVDIVPLSVNQVELSGGWTKVAIDFTVPSNASTGDVHSEIGFIVGFAAEVPSQPFEVSLILGQINVFLTPPKTQGTPRIIWADFEASKTEGLKGVLTWEVATTLGPMSPITVTSLEDPIPAWLHPESSEHSFLHYNVYVQPFTQEGGIDGPESSIFIGTTGLDGKGKRFPVEDVMLPKESKRAKEVRFYIQGMTDKGDVLSWAQSVYVDVTL